MAYVVLRWSSSCGWRNWHMEQTQSYGAVRWGLNFISSWFQRQGSRSPCVLWGLPLTLLGPLPLLHLLSPFCNICSTDNPAFLGIVISPGFQNTTISWLQIRQFHPLIANHDRIMACVQATSPRLDFKPLTGWHQLKQSVLSVEWVHGNKWLTNFRNIQFAQIVGITLLCIHSAKG